MALGLSRGKIREWLGANTRDPATRFYFILEMAFIHLHHKYLLAAVQMSLFLRLSGFESWNACHVTLCNKSGSKYLSFVPAYLGGCSGFLG